MKGASDHWEATATRTCTARPVDAIITPAAASAPFKRGQMAYQGYTEFCNMQDYTAAVFPVTVVDKERDVQVHRNTLMGEWDRYTYDMCRLVLLSILAHI